MINKNSSDTEIINSILSGQDINFKYLIEKYKSKGFALAFRILKNRFDAEEILQDSFIKAYNSLGRFRNESKFSTYLYSIIYNTSISFIRSQKKEIEPLTDELYLTSSYEFDKYEKSEINEFINKIINKLPADYAAVLTLFYLNELTCEEISKITEDSISNVKVKLHRARNLLKSFIIKNNYVKELI